MLGRPTVNLDTPEIQRFIAGRRVLVTGAGGSIGSELCRQIVRFCPKRLTLVDRSEFGLFETHRELQSRWIGSDLRACVADVRDRRRLRDVLADERPHVLFHAAAHKHVGLMEDNPGEAVKVNVLGTAALADAAIDAKVGKFVFISTDKAVNPAGVMGATKRAAELVIRRRQDEARHTRFCCVRFGNVLGSSGSVVPIFAKQIAEGGPVTVTHPAMKRFLMTIPEAAGLVMQAGATAEGGEVFVLEMGEPVAIVELAHAMIRRAGYEPGRDISIRYTGARPGEKLEEELDDGGGGTIGTAHEKIRIWNLPDVVHVDPAIALARCIDAPGDVVRRALSAVVAEYEPFGRLQQTPLRLAA